MIFFLIHWNIDIYLWYCNVKFWRLLFMVNDGCHIEMSIFEHICLYSSLAFSMFKYKWLWLTMLIMDSHFNHRWSWWPWMIIVELVWPWGNMVAPLKCFIKVLLLSSSLLLANPFKLFLWFTRVDYVYVGHHVNG